MKRKQGKTNVDESASLRRRAERSLAQRAKNKEETGGGNTAKLIHELQVHQIELEMQNESLRKAQAAVEESRNRYFDLYDFAPVGYFTFDQKGMILEGNLAGAKLLGVARSLMLRLPFIRFLSPESRGAFHLHLKTVFSTGTKETCELRLIKKASNPFYVSLESISSRDNKEHSIQCRSAVSDITERKKAELAIRESGEKCRYLSSQLLVAQEAERHRIAGDIHDAIGHGLISLKYQIEPLLTRMRNKGLDEEIEQLERMNTILSDTIAETRRVQQDLRPSMLEDLGLLVTIGWLCREFAQVHSAIRIDQKVEIAEKEVPISLRLVIFRILQEALNNVAKHSKASLVRLSLTRVNEKIELMISDNGQGFDVKETTRHGLGLESMRERVELSNGSFSIESAKNKGTTVRVTWTL